jgi:ribosomal protein S6--L-glutamate ligase|tara:strand:- start:1645 stop:2061 length:417 start_codon:yes stop_codon:yes gene_type:complete
MKKVLIGRDEMISFPDLGVGLVDGRVDTGARTSALHAANIEIFEKDDERWVRFDFEDYSGLEARLWKQKYVRSSNGKKQSRYFIKSYVKFVNGEKYPITLSLTDRSKMKFPVLLGRRLLSGRFLVDVGQMFMLGKKDE